MVKKIFYFGIQVNEGLTKDNLYSEEKGFGFQNSNWIKSEDKDILSKVIQLSKGADYIETFEDYILIKNKTWNEERCDEGFVTTFTYTDTSVFSVDLDAADYDVFITAKNKDISITMEGIKKVPIQTVNEDEKFVLHYEVALINGQLNIQFVGENVRIVSVEIIKREAKHSTNERCIFIASDSTVMSYKEDKKPQTGWGEVLSDYFDERITVVNKAIAGRSSRSFVEEGRLDEILLNIKPKDYLFIQFAHNDNYFQRPARYVSVKNFEQWLMVYINGARQRGAIPILITPVPMKDFDENGCKISFSPYRDEMIRVSEKNKVLLLDLGRAGADFLTEFGEEESKAIFLHVPAGVFKAYPNGAADNAHYQVFGARQMAQILVKLIRRNKNTEELSKYLKKIEVPELFPTEPNQFKLVNVDFNKVILSWDKVNSADIYYIYKKELDGKYSKCGASAFTVYEDKKCKESQTYFYKVTAVNALGNSPFSPELKVVTSSSEKTFVFDGSVKKYDKSLGYGFDEHNNEMFIVDVVEGDYWVSEQTVDGNIKERIRSKQGKLCFSVSNKVKQIRILADVLAPVALRYYELNLESTPPTVVLTWIKAEKAVEYKVYRAVENQEYVNVINSKSVVYFEESASLGNVYNYYVTGVLEDGSETAPSNVITVKMINE